MLLKETKIFDHYPALTFSLWAFLGKVFGLTLDPAFLIPLFPLFFANWKQIILGSALFLMFFYTADQPKELPPEFGFGIFKVGDIQEQRGQLFIKGRLIEFNETVYDCPFSMRVKKIKENEIAFHKYLLFSGSISKNTIKASSLQGASPSNFSFPWLRFYIKKKLLNYMESNVPNGEVLSSLLFGSPVPKHIATSIKRFGLSHLFAISGFHFNLITTLLALMLRPFVSHRIFHWVIIILLTLYAILIGPNPSLLRGFLSQALLFLGLALGKESFALNSIGVSLFFITLFFPHLITNLGFIFSFLITFALLVIYPLVTKHLMPKKPSWIMGPLSLLIAVELVSIPLNFTLFGSYPLFSPLYNLFVTPLISFSLFLAPLAFIPYVSYIVAIPLNLALMTFDVPASADIIIRYTLPIPVLIGYLTILFSAAVLLNQNDDLISATC